jgi:hypothetical protein
MDAYRCLPQLSSSASISPSFFLRILQPPPPPTSPVPSGEFHDNVKEGWFSRHIASCALRNQRSRAIAGFGSMRFYNGDNYEGEWLNDRRHGQGKQQ